MSVSSTLDEPFVDLIFWKYLFSSFQKVRSNQEAQEFFSNTQDPKKGNVSTQNETFHGSIDLLVIQRGNTEEYSQTTG